MSVITRCRKHHPPARPSRWAGIILLCVAAAHLAGAASDGSPQPNREAVDLSPAELDSMTALEDQRLRARADSLAIATLTALVATHPDSAGLLSELGYAHLRAKNFDLAEKAFKAAKKLDKRLAEAYVGHGLVYVEKPTRGVSSLYGYRRALGEAKRATKIDSTYAPAYRLLGEIHERFGEDHEKAIRYFLKYVELEPADPDGLYFFGLACVQAKKPGLVVEHVAPSLATHPNEVRLLPLVAQAYFVLERYGIALEYFERYVQNLDEAERALYTDIALVASEKERDEYRDTPEAEQVAYLESFWRRRDPDILTRINERIIEHYRRVWFARTFFSKRIHPWDRRGEVYIRYGEPDYRSRSILRKVTMNPSVDALRMRAAIDMYGHEASYHTFTGPVFPIRTRDSNFGQGFTDLSVADMSPEDLEDFAPEASAPPESPFEDILQDPDAPPLVQDIMQNFGDESTNEGTRDLGTNMNRFDESMNLDMNLNFGGYAPVTMKSTGSLVPWESWAYTQVNRGIEITFTDETGNGRFDFAPVPPLATTGGRRDARIASRITRHAPELVYNKAAADVPDYYRPGIMGPPVEFYYDMANFRGSDGQSTLEVYYGIPTSQVEAAREADSTYVHVKCFLALADEGHTNIYRDAKELVYRSADTLRTTRGIFVPELLKLDVPPGRYELQVQLRDELSGHTGLYKQAVRVPDYGVEELQVSGIQLASDISDEAITKEQFRKGDVWVIPMPSRSYRHTQKVYAYYEIYNLTRDSFGQTKYSAEYTIRSSSQHGSGVLSAVVRGVDFLFRSRKPQVSVTYEQTGREASEREYFELDLSKAKPGINTLEVTIEDLVSGQIAEREIRFRYGKR